MLGCGPNGCCGDCANCPGKYAVNLGEVVSAPVPYMPRTQRVLYDYVVGKLQRREPFYISETVNSDVLASDNMGFLAAIASAVSSILPAVNTAATVAGTAAALKGAKKGAQLDPNEIAAAITPAVKAQLQAEGVNLPSEVAPQISMAAFLDIFGEKNRPWVVAGMAGIGLILLLKLMSR